MTSDKELARKKRTMALILFLIMFGGIFTAIPLFGPGILGEGGGAGSIPTPVPTPPPAFQESLSSFADALRLSPANVSRVSFTDERGLLGTDLGGYIAQRHSGWTQIYGATVAAEARLQLANGAPLWLHAIGGPAPRARPVCNYRNVSVVEFFPGQQPWLGIALNTEPLVTGVRPPARAGGPCILGMDLLLDLWEGKTRETAWDAFHELTTRLPAEAQFATFSTAPVRGWDNRSAFAVVPKGNETYRLVAVLQSFPSAEVRDALGKTVHQFQTANPTLFQRAVIQILTGASSWDALTPADKQSLVVHEIGHALGLDHSSAPDSLMAPQLQIQSSTAQSPGEQDIRPLKSIYSKDVGTDRGVGVESIQDTPLLYAGIKWPSTTLSVAIGPGPRPSGGLETIREALRVWEDKTDGLFRFRQTDSQADIIIQFVERFGQPYEKDLPFLQINATAQGVTFFWSREAGGGDAGDLVQVEAQGNWSQLLAGIRDWGFLPPNE